jgi:endoglucanase
VELPPKESTLKRSAGAFDIGRMPRLCLPRPFLPVLAFAVMSVLLPAGAAHAATSVVEAEAMSLPSWGGMPVSEPSASGGRELLIWSNAAATATVTTTAARRLVVRVRGDQCEGAPQMTVTVDGHAVLTQSVSSTTWTTAGADVALPNGAHSVSVSFDNDANGPACDRNLRLDTLTISSTAGWPFAGKRFYVDPDGAARRQADAWRTSRPADAAQIDKIAAQPQAAWFGGWNADVTADVRALVDRAHAAGRVPALVAYNIPQRDCGAYSAGGASSADAYRTWIRGLAEGVGTRSAAVLLEPDALAGIDCLSVVDRDRRLALLRDAVAVLSARSGVSVYLDGGHAHWQPAAEIASRLRAAGVADAQGFVLNVSNFVSSSDNAGYGAQVASLTDGKHFVIDTSRNGLGPAADGEWCNPAGRALGAQPGDYTGVSRQDANLWVKRPGESDGSCHGGPAAGQWWADYALGLAQRAAY